VLCWALNLVGYRLANQQLAQQRFERPSDVVTWLGAVQAQDYSAAKWAVGQRLPACTDAEIEQFLAKGAILRTHVMRPTWHFVSPADIRWMLALTAPRVNAVSAYYYRQFDLDAAFFARSHKVIIKALEGGRQFTRTEIASVLQRTRLVKCDAPGVNQRMGHIMLRAELDCVVCSGARRGKQFTYALLDERAPRSRTLSRSEALAELSIRYFTSHGPATLLDFVWWSGLTVKDARTGLEMVKSKLRSEVSGQQTYWIPDSIPPARNAGRNAYLLPNFDEYIVGYADRRAICGEVHLKPADSRGNVLFNHTIVLDGKIAGTWKRSLTKDRVFVEAKPFAPISSTQVRKIAAAADRYGAFLGLEADVSIHRLSK
jgi:hypothetical protein